MLQAQHTGQHSLCSLWSCGHSTWLPQHQGRGLYYKLQAYSRMRSTVPQYHEAENRGWNIVSWAHLCCCLLVKVVLDYHWKDLFALKKPMSLIQALPDPWKVWSVQPGRIKATAFISIRKASRSPLPTGKSSDRELWALPYEGGTNQDFPVLAFLDKVTNMVW